MRKRFSFGSAAASTTSVNATSGTSSNSPSSFSVTPSPLVPTTFSDNLPLPSVFVFDLDYTLWPFWVDTHCSPPLKPITASPSSTEVTKLRDRHGEDFGFYTTVPPILWAARQRGITMSIASRTHAPQLADAMLRSLTISPPPAPSPSSDTGGPTTTTTTTRSMPPNAFFNNNRDSSYYDESRSSRGGGGSSNSAARKPIKAITLFTAPQIYPGSKVAHLKKIQALIPAGHASSLSQPTTTATATGGGARRSLMSPSPAPSFSSTTTTSTSKKRRSMAILGGGGSSRKNKEETEQGQEEERQRQQDNNNKRDGRIPFEDMIFFDDEARNRNVETELGVTFVLVRDGLTRDEVDRGVWEWRRRRLGIVQASSSSQERKEQDKSQQQQQLQLQQLQQQTRNTKDSSQVEAGNGAAVDGFVEMEG